MKRSKFAIYLLSVLAIVACVDIAFSLIVEKVMDRRFNPQIHKTYSADSDIAIIGASRASHHYIPEMLEDSLNLSATNYGIDGRNIYVHYALLKSLVNNSEKKPSVVILDLSNVDVYNTPGFNKERINVLYPYYKDSVVYDVLSDLLEPQELASLRYSGLVRHNSNLLQYSKDYVSGEGTGKGYEPLYGVLEDEREREMDAGELDPEKIKYLNLFIDECKANDIKLYIVTSPFYTIYDGYRWVDEIERISDSKGVPYIHLEKDSVFLAHRDWFSDPAHLNDRGARELTKRIIREISQK